MPKYYRLEVDGHPTQGYQIKKHPDGGYMILLVTSLHPFDLSVIGRVQKHVKIWKGDLNVLGFTRQEAAENLVRAWLQEVTDE